VQPLERLRAVRGISSSLTHAYAAKTGSSGRIVGFGGSSGSATRSNGENFPGGHVGFPNSLNSTGLCANADVSSARNGTTSGSSRPREKPLYTG